MFASGECYFGIAHHRCTSKESPRVAQRQRGTMAATPMLGLIPVPEWLASEHGNRDKSRMPRDCGMCSLVSVGSKGRESGF